MKTLLAAAAIVAVASPVLAAECGPHDDVLEQMENRFGEQKIGIGIDRRGQVAELLVNPETGTWTMVYSTPDGLACIVGAGEGWHRIPPTPPGDPA